MTVPTFGHSSKNQEKDVLILNFTTFSSFKVFHISKAKRREKIILDHYLLRCTIAFFFVVVAVVVVAVEVQG